MPGAPTFAGRWANATYVIPHGRTWERKATTLPFSRQAQTGSLQQEPAQGSGLTYGVVVVVAALAGGHFWMHALKLL